MPTTVALACSCLQTSGKQKQGIPVPCTHNVASRNVSDLCLALTVVVCRTPMLLGSHVFQSTATTHRQADLRALALTLVASSEAMLCLTSSRLTQTRQQRAMRSQSVAVWTPVSQTMAPEDRGHAHTGRAVMYTV